jgi:cytochrome c oxidase assembly factor CtaG
VSRWRLIPLLAASAANAYAHAGEPPEPHDLWGAWSLDPGVVVPLALTALLFAAGAKRSRGVSASQAACFWLGWLVLAVALLSPLHRLGEALFSAHMAQHEFLMLLAAPLLVLSRPLIPILWGLPIRWRRALGQWSKKPLVTRSWFAVTRPAVAWCVHAAALWLWHAPRLFQATLTSDWIHSAQHISFLGSALLFWWSLFYAQGRTGYGSSVLYIFTTAVHTSILGALLTFSVAVWYPDYAPTTATWGVLPLEDQQIGGLIMWIPAGVVYLGAGLWLLALWLRESDNLANQRRYAQ